MLKLPAAGMRVVTTGFARALTMWAQEIYLFIRLFIFSVRLLKHCLEVYLCR